MNCNEPTCPNDPHAHLFSMKCYNCSSMVKVFHDCGFSDVLDPDSPKYDETMKTRRIEWIHDFGLPMAPSKATGDLGVVCKTCGALQGAFFIMERFMEIAYEPQEYETVVMKMSK